MISRAPREARWLRSEPRRFVPASDLHRIVERALGKCSILDVQPLTDGLRNANFKIRLNREPRWIVLRMYEHDPSLCQKEVDLLSVAGKTVPVPQVIHAEPGGLDELPPSVVMEYLEGLNFRELKRGGDREAIAQAAAAIGKTLAAIGHIAFERSGWLAPGPTVIPPLHDDMNPAPHFVESCLASANLQRRMPEELRTRVSAMIWSWAAELCGLNGQAHLVHGDFGKRNLLVRCEGGQWLVAAVLDWEYAVSGSPLIDVGHFLRYERADQPCLEPHFSRGFVSAGGVLPQNWRTLARLVDMAALCESLTHDDLPHAVVVELLELIRATAEDRDATLE